MAHSIIPKSSCLLMKQNCLFKLLPLSLNSVNYCSKKDESERLEQLLKDMKLRSTTKPQAKLSQPMKKPKIRSLEKDDRPREAIKAVVRAVPEDLKSKMENDLISQLNNHRPTTSSLKELFLEMKVQKEPGTDSHGNRIKLLMDDNLKQRGINAKLSRQNLKSPPKVETLADEMKNSKELNIFDGNTKLAPCSFLSTMDILRKKELALLKTHPPKNGFEELILWTEQGKLWHFPIDNEQGLDEERAIGFQEHIFLNKHLKPWCPQSGPIAHFMELVCVGLSKNPFLSVKEKKNHIMWYKNYFDQHRDVLEDVYS